jgi:heat shock protein HtpX
VGRKAWTIAFLIALVTNGVATIHSDKLALRSMRARPVSEAEQPTMYRIVRELSTASRQPMPRLYVSPDPGPTPSRPVATRATRRVCCTDGILAILDERELRGVLGHELSHVYNRDILISSVAAGLASVIMYLGYLAWLCRSAQRRRRRPGADRRARRADPRPGRAGLIQMAISRSREFQADASGARSPATRSRSPLPCASSSKVRAPCPSRPSPTCSRPVP